MQEDVRGVLGFLMCRWWNGAVFERLEERGGQAVLVWMTGSGQAGLN